MMSLWFFMLTCCFHHSLKLPGHVFLICCLLPVAFHCYSTYETTHHAIMQSSWRNATEDHQQLTVALWNAQLLNSYLILSSCLLPLRCLSAGLATVILHQTPHFVLRQDNRVLQEPKWLSWNNFAISPNQIHRNANGNGQETCANTRFRQVARSELLSPPSITPNRFPKIKSSIWQRNNWLQFKELISPSGNRSSKSDAAPCFFPIPQNGNEDRDWNSSELTVSLKCSFASSLLKMEATLAYFMPLVLEGDVHE